MDQAVIPTAEELAKVSKLFEVLLDDKGRKRLLCSATRRSLKAGEVVCREGERGDEFYLLLGGRVSVTADNFGTAKSVAILGRGRIFGEMSMLTQQPRSATVTTDEAGDVLVFKRADVDGILAEYPLVRQALGKLGLRRTEQLFEKLSED